VIPSGPPRLPMRTPFLPPTELEGGGAENPLIPANPGVLLQEQINQDAWEAMKGELPCLSADDSCIATLQAQAVSQNPLLLEIDFLIEEINARIAEAKTRNQTAIQLSVLKPALQVFLQDQGITEQVVDANGQLQTRTRQRGPIQKLFSLFSAPLPILNELIRAVGIPLLEGAVGGNDQAQSRAIAISDLSVKVAQLQRDRAQLANEVKEKVMLAVLDFDQARRAFQATLLEIQLRSQQLQIFMIDFSQGNYDSVQALAQENAYHAVQLSAFREWGQVRAQVERIKLLVLGVGD
jgi:hypothetical protein